MIAGSMFGEMLKTDDYIIGCDISETEDLSCVALACLHCKTFIDFKYFKSGEKIEYPQPTKCSNCGTEFKTYFESNCV